MKQHQKIRLVRAPKLKLFAPAHIVDGFEIKWDTRVQAWEMATPDHHMYSFRIGRVVNGKTFITEMVNDTEPATGDLSDRANRALTKLRNQGVDLGEWEQDQQQVEETESK